MTMQRIKEAAEKAKMELSSATETDISLPFIDMGKDNPPINFETHLTRLQFEEMTKDLFERTKEPIQKALQDANLTIDMIDDVLLDGESTEIPAIRLLLRDLFKKEPNSSINPCYVVAIGAAYYGNFVNNNSNNKQF
ncbi:Hsp70 family protein [bacterium]|nr:Hsp70 family protein [bacterium]